MRKQLTRFLLIAMPAMIMVSCRTTAPKVDYEAIVKASLKLGMDIDYKDNHALYTEAAEWLGAPYRTGGNSKRGADCSGLAVQLYRKVYRIRLPRTSDEQYQKSAKVAKRNLNEGDLVFFTSSNSGKRVAHSGIYLKDGKFIHASSSRGVIISNLSESYYRKYWKAGGRFRK